MSRIFHTIIKYLPSPFRDSLFYRCLHQYVIPNGREKEIRFRAGRSLQLNGVSTDIISRSIYFRGYYEKKLTKLVASIGVSGGVMVDVGANIGYFSLSFASYHPKNKVYAFEPSSRNLPLLTANIAANSLEEQVTIIPFAVSDENTELFFEHGPSEQTGWGHLSGSPTSQKVRVVTLDEYFSQQNITIDILKIDVEGADLKVILGAAGLIRSQKIKMVVFECWENFMNASKDINSDAAQVAALLLGAGYQFRKLEPGSYMFRLPKGQEI